VKALGGQPVAAPHPEDLGLSPEKLAVVRAGLCDVVNDHGTGWRARLESVMVCGKTGSAQVVSHTRLARAGAAPDWQPHGWFAAYAPAEQPRIALAVLVEHGGSGGEAAAPVAREILAAFFREARPQLAALAHPSAAPSSAGPSAPPPAAAGPGGAEP
jgi:penicillin-binding protein 2